MGTGRIKKNTLRAKMLGILMLCAITSLLAAGIVSYMALRMIQNDSIEDNMKMYLDQITRNTDGAYYDMLSIMNYMGPGGLVGNVTDSYLGATDNFDRFIEQRTLREEMAGLGYVNTKLVGVMYYDREEKKELISGMNVRALDGSHASLPEVVECAGNVIQAAHSSILGSGEEPVFSVMREVVFGNGKRLDVYAEIEADMKTPEEINKAGRPYTYIQTDERRITRYSTNPVIIQGQKLFSTTLSKGDYQVETREGYKIMAYRSQMGYINAVALPDNMYQNEINHWRMRMTLIIVASFLIFALSVFYLYRIICRPLNQFRRQMVQIGNGALQAVHEESDIAEFDSMMREVEQMKCQIENLISNMVEKEKSIQKTEYEKLIYQINPHFLLNTLNSVQWMAQMNVLIVDDDKLARKGLIAIMDWEKYGFKVAGDVQNGRKALEFLRTHPVDIVFTDIDMPEIDGLELMQMCKEEFPDIKFVIFSVYENFSYAQTAIRMGALDYISKISFSPEECEQILERVSAKYRQTSRDGQADGEDREKLRELSRRWMYTGWIFNEKEFEDLCRETKEISLRSAERIFVKSFHDIQILSGGEGEFPSLDTVEEMLDWVRRWRENIYEVCRSTPQKNDICAFAAVILYVDEHIGEELRSEDAAERIGMSRSYFSTRFKEMTGETFHQYVIHRKMKAAAERIEEGGKSITQIATELGYDNFHYFARVFAREHGCNPSEYRKERKNV